MELQARYGELRDLGMGVAAITYDPPATIEAFADERRIEFALLSDQDHDIVERYGIVNRQYEPGHRNYGIPYPGTFILDRDGRVLARYFEEEYQYRNTAASVALKIGRPLAGASAPSRYETPHLDVATFVTDETVAPGHRFSIVLDITPRSGVRIVARGEQGYRAVSLSLESGDTFRVYPMSHPESATILLAPRNEQLTAYTESFRLVQDAAVLVSADTRELAKQPESRVTLEGTLEYQACTESTCHPPERVPLSWIFALKPLG